MSNEAPHLVAAFADHYLRLGARKVTVFADGDGPTKLAARPGLEIVALDAAFWADQGLPRPAGVEDRQRALYRLAYGQDGADWVLFADTDEFVVGLDAVAQRAAQLGEDRVALRVASGEAVFRPGEDWSRDLGQVHFRAPMNRVLAQVLPRLVYPGQAGVFIRGLLGHAIGKQFVRRGIAGLEIGIHSVLRNGVVQAPEVLAEYRQGGVFLAHFDAISLPRWQAKWQRRLAAQDTREMGRKRDLQMERVRLAAEQGPDAVERLFAAWYVLSDRQYGALRALGLAFACDVSLGR